MVHIHKDATKNLFSDFLPVFQYFFVLLFLMSDVSFCVLLIRSFTAEGWVLMVHCPCKLKTVAFRLKTQVLSFSQLVGATEVEFVVVKRIL